MFGPIPQITLIMQNLKLLNDLRNILQADISNGIPCIFVFIWPSNGLETQRGNQPLYWSSQIIFWFWRLYFNLVQANKIWRDVQGDVLLNILDIHVFLNIDTTTIFHVHRCEHSLPGRLPSGSTMINRWCCYKF